MSDALARWEPRIESLDVLVTNDVAGGRLVIEIRYRLRATGGRTRCCTPSPWSVRDDAGLTPRAILPPDLDDRTWQDLVDEMRALIPKYAPQWTDHNPSDLGITLIELFAWLGEGIIFRLNQTPEKNYLALLNLLGITRDPPTPARTYLTFTSGARRR